MDEGPRPSARTPSGRQVEKESCAIGEQSHKKVEIRPARAGDIEDLLVIEQQCFNVYYYAFYTFDRKDFEFYLDDSDTLFLAATLDRRLVGYVLGPVETWRTPPAAHIDSIAVLPELQHQGIGSRLIESHMEGACRLGCELVTLEVSPANEVGMAFFARYGFRKVHRLRNYYGKGLHGLLMAASCERPRSNE
ncbi:MAG: N-acetyltransferase [Phycisphaerales bacterium]